MKMAMELSEAFKSTIAAMVDEIRDRLDDLVHEEFPFPEEIEGDVEKESEFIDAAYEAGYGEFLRQFRNEPIATV
jgi:hypothetical protein